jgi:hypothetical protein
LLALAFVGYFLYTTFASKPKVHGEQLLLSDVVQKDDPANKDAAFHKKLDALGPYTREPNGLLTKESTINLKRAISEKAFLDFRLRRDDLMQQRVAMLRLNKQKEYTASVGKSMSEYRDQTQKVTMSALAFLGISEEVYVNSFKALAASPETSRLMD